MAENFKSLAYDLECLKSQCLYSTKLIQPWLEKIWFEIVFNDCAMSMLHLCHMGILLETVTRMHAENDLQLQEEMMLQRSNEMGSQLAKLMMKFNMSNTDIVKLLLDQEKLQKQKVVAIECEAEFFMADWITDMGEVNKVLEQNIEFLKDVTCSNHALKGELVEANKANKKLLDRILNLEADYDKDKSDIIRALELDLSKEREALTLQVSENQELRTHIKGALTRRKLANNGLTKRMEITESLEDEILKMNSVFSQMNDAFKNLSSDLDDVTNERDQL
ncbi:hypothetical protein JHK85_001579 [Glycine max]|nr:hypothetical protein JHK85_001579 [Glycine max]